MADSYRLLPYEHHQRIMVSCHVFPAYKYMCGVEQLAQQQRYLNAPGYLLSGATYLSAMDGTKAVAGAATRAARAAAIEVAFMMLI